MLIKRIFILSLTLFLSLILTSMAMGKGSNSLGAMPKSLTSADSPQPYIEAFAWYDRYSLVDWPEGKPVSVTIANPDYTADPFTPDSSQGRYDFLPGVDLKPGSVITASNGETTKVLEISPLSATVVNPKLGKVTGVASSGSTFHMRTGGDHFNLPIDQDITVDSYGKWSVTIGSYLPWEWYTGGSMWEGDEDGDVTFALWHVHNELVEVWLVQNELIAYDWPLNTSLTFTVEDPETDKVYKFFASTQPQVWMNGTTAVVNAGNLKLVPGMKVTVSDGKVRTSTKIEDIKITKIDVDKDIVYGTAPHKAQLELYSPKDSPALRFFTSDKKGNWMVDYTKPSVNGATVDLVPGDILWLFMREKDKDSTVWGIFVPNP